MTIIPFPGAKKQSACGCGKPRRISRLSLPVSPRALGRVRFSGSEVSMKAMLPIEALTMLEVIIQNGIVPDVVELSGPGDPLAELAKTFATLELIHGKHPEIPLGIKTLGVGGEEIAAVLSQKGVTRATLQMDGVDAEVLQKLYAWIRPGNKTIPLAKGVSILLDEQERALKSFCRAGIGVTVRTTVYPGINDEHVEEVARRVAELGAEAMMIVPCIPQPDKTGFPSEPNDEMMDLLHARSARHIRIVDGQNGYGEAHLPDPETGGKNLLPVPAKERPNVAVASSNGMDVDLHLGHAIRMLVYGPRDDGLVCLLESRDAPEPGGGSARWEALADTLPDCFALLAAGAGESPRNALARRGIHVMISEGEIEGIVDVLYGGGKKKRKKE